MELNKDIKKIDLLLPDREIKAMVQMHLIAEDVQASERSNRNAVLSRAVSWMTICDCAILTAWRGDKKRKQNDDDNRELMKSLRAYGYGVSKVRGCYTEVGQLTSRENSYLVVDLLKKRELFKTKIYGLSEHYQQDCFLFKPAGANELAYLIGTNDDFGIGCCKPAGRLHIGILDAEAYSEIGSGRLSFHNDTDCME